MDKRILVINPGSTSTKLALFQGEQKLFDAAVRHSKEDLSPFSWVMNRRISARPPLKRNCPPTMWI